MNHNAVRALWTFSCTIIINVLDAPQYIYSRPRKGEDKAKETPVTEHSSKGLRQPNVYDEIPTVCVDDLNPVQFTITYRHYSIELLTIVGNSCKSIRVFITSSFPH